MPSAPNYVIRNGGNDAATVAVLLKSDGKTTTTACNLPYKQKPKYYTAQILATLSVALGSLAAGLGKGYSSPAIASLQATNTSSPSDESADVLTVTAQQASWVASLSLLGALFGAISGGLAMKFGRRSVLLAGAVPFAGSWLLTSLAVNVETMYVTSFVGGFSCAIILMVSQVYISEISDPGIRGSMSAILKIFQHIGILSSFALGALLDWRQLAAVISIGPVVLFLTVFYMPETPSFLMLNGREEEAADSLRWLKGGSEYQVREELHTIRENLVKSDASSRRFTGKLSRPILVTCGLMFFQRLSGANAFNFYAVSIFRQIFNRYNPHFGAIIVCFVQLLASMASGALIDSVGRLPLLVGSSVFTSVALAAFGSYAYFAQTTLRTMNPQSMGCYDWIPLICVLIFTVSFTMGISPISWLLVGELFPLEYRGLGSGLAMTVSYGCAFLGVKTFVDFQEAFGLHGAFWLYSLFSAAGLCFVIWFVPETKGKHLDEMSKNLFRV